jgi:glucose/arabinose dehydrogenase
LPAATTAAEGAAPNASQNVDAAPAEEATAVAAATAAPTAPVTPAATTTSSQAGATPDAAAATEAPVATEAPAATSAPAETAAPAASGPVQFDGLSVALEPFAEGFANPLYVTNARDGSNRLFVVEKPGAIRIIADGQTLPQPFLDITDRVNSRGSEQGLLGLAFPPDFANRKFFFVNYTDRNGDTVVARYSVTADANAADPGSEFVVLKIAQPAANHNGGDLAFGPDGMLWIGTGDGGAANDRFDNGQNPETLLGKMLRIDVTTDPNQPYVAPADNPWLNAEMGGKPMRPEIWAIGLRNPWRYSFDRATGDLWIADVGQNQIEEVNVTRAPLAGGLNYGWPVQEGNACFRDRNCDPTGLEQPVAQYNHGQDGCSVTGGYVYRGQQFPALAGAYLYGDYCSGRIWGLDAGNPGAPVLLANAGSGLSSFGEDENGELYITDLATGVIRRIVVQ